MLKKCEIQIYLAKFNEVIMVNRAIYLNFLFNTFKYFHHKHTKTYMKRYPLAKSLMIHQFSFTSFLLP